MIKDSKGPRDSEFLKDNGPSAFGDPHRQSRPSLRASSYQNADGMMADMSHLENRLDDTYSQTNRSEKSYLRKETMKKYAKQLSSSLYDDQGISQSLLRKTE